VAANGMAGEACPGRAAAPLSYHGGDIAAARRHFPAAPEPWIDLSTGINPEPYPVGDLPLSAWARLPEPAAVAGVEAAAAAAYGAVSADAVVAAPGTQAVIQWLPRLVPARRVGILGPTYAEHERSWRAAGREVAVVGSLADLAGFDAAIVVNPNNPDGRLVPAADLAAASAAMPPGGCLVVDEAFMDVVSPGESLVPVLPPRGAVVLRSFGKTFGLAGLRLGFAVASPDLALSLRAALGPWAVSGPAAAIGRRALADRAWLSGAVARLERDAARLDASLRRAGFGIVGGTPLYRLASHDDAEGWFERLGRAGILVRPFVERPAWLRFGLPGEDVAWARLAAALGVAG
jgi:cobalamin biosynthetic protein CobC